MKWNAHEKELVSISNKIIATLIKKGVNGEDAKDIVQTSLLKLFELQDSISLDSIQGWLYRVSFNQFYTAYNRDNKFNELKEKYLIPELKQLEKDEFDEEYLFKALISLEEEEFNLILLKYIENLSYKELEIIFNQPDETLKKRAQRIRKKLKMIIKEMEKHDD